MVISARRLELGEKDRGARLPPITSQQSLFTKILSNCLKLARRVLILSRPLRGAGLEVGGLIPVRMATIQFGLDLCNFDFLRLRLLMFRKSSHTLAVRDHGDGLIKLDPLLL